MTSANGRGRDGSLTSSDKVSLYPQYPAHRLVPPWLVRVEGVAGFSLVVRPARRMRGQAVEQLLTEADSDLSGESPRRLEHFRCIRAGLYRFALDFLCSERSLAQTRQVGFPVNAPRARKGRLNGIARAASAPQGYRHWRKHGRLSKQPGLGRPFRRSGSGRA